MEPSIVCRACLTAISLEYIDLEAPLHAESTFLDCFNFCTKLEANLEDALPNSICVPCGRSLQIAYGFIKKSCDADRLLRDSLSFFGDIEHFTDNRAALKEIETILKAENIVEEIVVYEAEQTEELCDFNGHTVTEGKSDAKLLEFEVVDTSEELTAVTKQDKVDEHKSPSPFASGDEEEESNKETSDDKQCNICEEIVPSSDYDFHIRQHTENIVTKYNCDQCDLKFVSEKSVKIHKKNVHESRQNLPCVTCRWCGEAFFNRVELRKHHMNDHSSKPITTCLTCREQFPNENDLKQHVQEQHIPQRKAVKCPYCKKSYKDIKTHIKYIHESIVNMPLVENGKPKLQKHQCPECYQMFRYKSELKDHMNLHTGERPYKCNICDKSFYRKGIRNQHVRAIHECQPLPTLKCDKCKYSTKNEAVLKHHRKRHDRPREATKFLCSYCPRYFFAPRVLAAHESLSHGNGENAYECSVCKKKFIHREKLKTHFKLVHMISRPHQCETCKKCFRNSYQLKTHEALHASKNLQCPECDKKFSHHDLRIHMRTHTGEMPYGCDICGQRFAMRVRLTYHLQKHAGVKHKCQQCPREFNNKGKLRLHTFQHIGMPYVCDICEMGYPNKAGIRRHSQSVHNVTLTEEELFENRRKNEMEIIRKQCEEAVPIEPPAGIIITEE